MKIICLNDNLRENGKRKVILCTKKRLIKLKNLTDYLLKR